MRYLPLYCVAILLVCIGSARAQDSITAPSETKGLVTVTPTFDIPPPYSWIKLTVPDYPSSAKKMHLGGSIEVPVTVDAKGVVTRAGDATGPYPVCPGVRTPEVLALRHAAEAAAERSRFKPQAGVLTGSLTYSFGQKGETGPHVEAPKPGATDLEYETRIVDPGEKLPKLTDKERAELPDTVSGGVLNGRAGALPRPAYPAAAHAVHATGSVPVQVLILEDGTVFSAQAVGGHPLLRHNSEIAACAAKFQPTLLSGQPVKVSGIITYNYVP